MARARRPRQDGEAASFYDIENKYLTIKLACLWNTNHVYFGSVHDSNQLPKGGVDTMKQAVDAVYENGVFKPLKSPSLSDGQLVRLEIEPAFETSSDDLLELAAKVYEGLSDQQIAEVEKIVLDHRDFFGDRTR